MDTMSEYKEISLSEEEAEEVLTPTPEEAVEVDPEAPYGRMKNGKPYKHPRKSAAQTYAAAQAPEKRRGRPPKAKGVSYQEKAAALLSLPMMGIGIAAAATGSEALQADSATIVLYQPKLSETLGDLAEQKPEFAAVLDKMTAVGPYGALMMVALPMTLQVLANHKVIKPIEQLGVVDREQIIKAVAVEES